MKEILCLILLTTLFSCQMLTSPAALAIEEKIAEDVIEDVLEEVSKPN